MQTVYLSAVQSSAKSYLNAVGKASEGVVEGAAQREVCQVQELGLGLHLALPRGLWSRIPR